MDDNSKIEPEFDKDALYENFDTSIANESEDLNQEIEQVPLENNAEEVTENQEEVTENATGAEPLANEENNENIPEISDEDILNKNLDIGDIDKHM